MFDKKFLKDLTERVLVTVILSAIGIGLVYANKLDPAVAVAVVAVLNVTKAAFAKQFGNKDSGGFVNDLPDQIVAADKGKKEPVSLITGGELPPADSRTEADLLERAEFEADDDIELFEGQAPIDPEDKDEE